MKRPCAPCSSFEDSVLCLNRALSALANSDQYGDHSPTNLGSHSNLVTICLTKTEETRYKIRNAWWSNQKTLCDLENLL